MTKRLKPNEANNQFQGRPLSLDGPPIPRAPSDPNNPVRKKKSGKSGKGGSIINNRIAAKKARIDAARASGEMIIAKDIRQMCRLFAPDAIAIVAAALGGENVPYSVQLKAAEIILSYSIAKPAPAADENEVAVSDPIGQLVAVLSGKQTTVTIAPLGEENYEDILEGQKELILEQLPEPQEIEE
jgi:hypothetical protein